MISTCRCCSALSTSISDWLNVVYDGLAAMQPDKAREVTTKLAALRTKRAAVAQGN